MNDVELINSLAGLPPMTVQGHPLLFLILAMALPEIMQDTYSQTLPPWMVQESTAMIGEIRRQLPPEAVKLLEKQA